MWRRTPITVALASAYVVLAVYTVVILLTTPGSGLNAFVTDWLYQGLIAGSVLFAGARAVLVERDRLA